jgi:hypothetical protein
VRHTRRFEITKGNGRRLATVFAHDAREALVEYLEELGAERSELVRLNPDGSAVWWRGWRFCAIAPDSPVSVIRGRRRGRPPGPTSSGAPSQQSSAEQVGTVDQPRR